MVENATLVRGALSIRAKRRSLSALAVVAGLSLALTACSGETPAPEEPGGPGEAGIETVRYINNNAQPLVGLAGEQQGFFESNGVNVEFTELSTGTEAIAAMIGGSADFVTGADARLIQAASQDLPVVAVGIHNTGFLGSLITAADDTSINNMHDMVGKRIGIQVGSGIHNGWLRHIAALGLSESDFEVVSLSVPDMPAAIAAGSIDAAIVWQPYTSRSVAEGLTRVAMDTHEIAGPAGIVYPFYLMTTSDMINNRPEAVQRFVQAWVCTQQWIGANPDAAIAILEPAMQGLDAASVRATFEEQGYDDYQTIGQEIRTDTENQANALVSVGAISAVPDLTSHINTTFVDAALAKGC